MRSLSNYYEVVMNKSQVNILPGLQTQVWVHNGRTPGSTIAQRQNRKSVVRFINNLDIPDMMTQFEVGTGGIDPMSAPAKPLPVAPL